MDLPHDSSSVATARDRVRGELIGRGASRRAVEDAALVVSELVGNALQHADALPSGCLRLAWHTADARMEIAVSDGGSGRASAEDPLCFPRPGGRGLRIVEHLAEEWGVRHAAGVVTVWAVLPVSTADRSDDRSDRRITAV